MHVEQTDKGQIIAVPVRSGRSHVDVERGLTAMGLRSHVTYPDAEGQMIVRAFFEQVTHENVSLVRGVLQMENCELMGA